MNRILEGNFTYKPGGHFSKHWPSCRNPVQAKQSLAVGPLHPPVQNKSILLLLGVTAPEHNCHFYFYEISSGKRVVLWSSRMMLNLSKSRIFRENIWADVKAILCCFQKSGPFSLFPYSMNTCKNTLPIIDT